MLVYIFVSHYYSIKQLGKFVRGFLQGGLGFWRGLTAPKIVILINPDPLINQFKDSFHLLITFFNILFNSRLVLPI